MESTAPTTHSRGVLSLLPVASRSPQRSVDRRTASLDSPGGLKHHGLKASELTESSCPRRTIGAEPEFAARSIPQPGSLVRAAGRQPAAVGGEGKGQDRTFVAGQDAGGVHFFLDAQIPQPDGFVTTPGCEPLHTPLRWRFRWSITLRAKGEGVDPIVIPLQHARAEYPGRPRPGPTAWPSCLDCRKPASVRLR